MSCALQLGATGIKHVTRPVTVFDTCGLGTFPSSPQDDMSPDARKLQNARSDVKELRTAINILHDRLRSEQVSGRRLRSDISPCDRKTLGQPSESEVLRACLGI